MKNQKWYKYQQGLFKYITVVVFEEDVILNEPVENWPLCDCLISFHSKGIKKTGRETSLTITLIDKMEK